MEAVKQGSCAAAAKSASHVVIASVKRSQSELASYQRKQFKIDDHMGITMSGLTADGRVLCKYMRNQCLNHKFVFDAPMPVGRLVRQVADKAQACTQRSWKRPFGVGLLVAGYDSTGPHLFYNCPSGNYYEYYANAVGARSQASRTYLERHLDALPDMALDELVKHCLEALKASLQEGDLTAANTSVSLVGRGQPFTILENADVEPYLEMIKEEAPPAPEAPPTDTPVEYSGQAPSMEATEGDPAGNGEDTPMEEA